MLALRQLAIQVRACIGAIVKWTLYCARDTDKVSRRFSERNHDPRHVISRMQHRTFEAGQYYCEKHDANHDLPRAGVDLHVGTYPCSPWSRRGNRAGFEHPDAEVVIVGLPTCVPPSLSLRSAR